MVLYAAMGVVGYVVNGWGSILGPLRRQLGVPRSDVAFYPSLFAVALVAVGLLGSRVVERVGHRAALAGALGSVLAGVLLLCTSNRTLTLAGALVLGLGAALMVQVVPTALTLRQPAAAVAALGEANAVSSTASVLAPASVAAATAAGAGWQLGYLLPVLPVAAVLLAIFAFGAPPGAPRRHDDPEGPRPQERPTPGLEPGRLLGRWCDLLLAVSVEFCLVYWAADAFREWHGCTDAAATSLAAAFLAGMALTRCASARLTTGHPSTVVLRACATAAAGFIAFWTSPYAAAAAAGLFLAGTGIALLYPVTLARVVAAWPRSRDRAAARAALASGMAIGLAPLLLVRLAGRSGLHLAYLIVPALLLVLSARAVLTLRSVKP